MKKLFLLLSLLVLSLTACFIFKPDYFSGEWKLVIYTNPEESIGIPTIFEIKDNDLSIELKILKIDSFYNVELLLPTLPKKSTKKGWEEYLQEIQLALPIIKHRYTGKYTLSNDGKILNKLDGFASLEYKKYGNMLYDKNIGYFKKGKALLEVPKPKEELKK